MHELVADHAPAVWAELDGDQVAAHVVVGIETDRGPWVAALRAAGCQVYAINPLSGPRYRERHSTGAKSHAGDTELADVVKLVTRAHQTAIWERIRQARHRLATPVRYRCLTRSGMDRRRPMDKDWSDGSSALLAATIGEVSGPGGRNEQPLVGTIVVQGEFEHAECGAIGDLRARTLGGRRADVAATA